MRIIILNLVMIESFSVILHHRFAYTLLLDEKAKQAERIKEGES